MTIAIKRELRDLVEEIDDPDALLEIMQSEKWLEQLEEEERAELGEVLGMKYFALGGS